MTERSDLEDIGSPGRSPNAAGAAGSELWSSEYKRQKKKKEKKSHFLLWDLAKAGLKMTNSSYLIVLEQWGESFHLGSKFGSKWKML